METILQLDCSTETAQVSLSVQGRLMGSKENRKMTDHASWLQVAIKDTLEEAGIPIRNLDAVAVVAGPGSYTGIRVGMASAKGICYALDIPMITLNSLVVLAHAAARNNIKPAVHFLCPMLDARRMEVFTAVYTPLLEEVRPPSALVLTDDAYADLLAENRILFLGSGSLKWKAFTRHSNALFADISCGPEDLVALATNKFRGKDFTSVAYAEPVYLKAFYSTQKPKPA